MTENQKSTKMRQLNKLESLLMLAGSVLMIVGAALYVFGMQTIAPLIFVPGTLLFFLMQWRQKYEGHDITLRRLRRLMLAGGFCFILAALLMAENSYHILYPYFYGMGLDGINAYLNYIHNNWVLALLVGAILQLYTTHRISAELKKQGK